MHHACIIARRALCQAKLSQSIVLPAGKLCTLVALYNQSQPFITPEKLDDGIDRAFADMANVCVFGREMNGQWCIGSICRLLGCRSVESRRRAKREREVGPLLPMWFGVQCRLAMVRFTNMLDQVRNEPDPRFRFEFVFLVGPNLNWGLGSTPWVNLNLRSEPEPRGSMPNRGGADTSQLTKV